MSRSTSIVPFEELGVGDVAIAGGKGANLGELCRAEFPVPPGFVIGAPAYLQAMTEGGVRSDLVEIERALDVEDASALAEGSSRLQELVRKAGLPATLRAELLDAYHHLGSDLRVAVRSSATAEDTAAVSFAGMNQTFTNVRGDEDLCARVVDCWASLFGRRVLSYRRTSNITDEPAIAVVVQQMVESERSGVMFTVDPATGDPSVIVIEGAIGLGEVVVGGQVEPDTYRVAKDGPRVTDVRVGRQSFCIRPDANGVDQRVELTAAEGDRRVLLDEQILDLARHRPARRESLRKAPRHRVGDFARRAVPRAVAPDHDGRARHPKCRPSPSAGACWCAARVRLPGTRSAGCGSCGPRPKHKHCNRARSWSRP